MSGYYCRDCGATRPLFASPEPSPLALPCLGSIPFDPELALSCDRGLPLSSRPDGPVARAYDGVAQRLLDGLAFMATTSARVQTVAPPERGSLSIVYACPACGYEMAMLTNAHETQVVQSLGVRIGRRDVRAGSAETVAGAQPAKALAGAQPAEALVRAQPAEALAEAGCPFAAMVPAAERAADAVAVRWTEGAEARLANIPAFVRPMARTGIEQFASERGLAEVDEAVLDAAREHFGM
jgi:hypothetical protein